MRSKLRLGLLAGGAVAALALAPSAASASPCGLGDTTGTDGLLDPGGYEFDINQNTTPAPARDVEAFATLFDGGAGTATTPAGPRTASDTYDSWGALFVGAGGDAGLANQYHSGDDNSCVYEDGGRTVAFPVLPLGGLVVQRRIHVGTSGLSGARLIDTLTNRTGKPVVTSVQVGDTQSSDNAGDLGADSGTEVRASSSGDAAFGLNDTWIVTSDDDTTNSDLALASVLGGPGARERVDLATFAGIPAEGPEDNLAWRFDAVKVQPGQTVTIASASIQAGVSGSSSPAEAALASSVAGQYQGSVAGAFPTLSRTELATLANWATPVKCGGRPVTIAGSDSRDVIVGTQKPDVIFAGGGNDKVRGLKGNDRICGGAGKDKLLGGGGKRDVLKGGGGKDREVQ